MELEGLGKALGGFYWSGQQGFDKVAGLRFAQLDGIVAANHFLSCATNMGHDEGAFQRRGASQQRLVFRSDPCDGPI